MAKLSAMPMFWTDFFADTEHLPEEAAKAYLFLLGHAWIRKACLPNDDRALARLARLSFKKWTAIRGDVMAFFEVNEDGHLHNPRLTKEWKWVAQRVTHNRENGSLGGQKNAAKKLNENNETPVATATDSLKQPTPTPTPTPRKEESESSFHSDSCPPADDFDEFWKAYPRKEKKPKARQAFTAACRRASPALIIEGACRYAEAARAHVEPKYWPHPTSWLNGDCWNDPLPVAPRTAKSGTLADLATRMGVFDRATDAKPIDPVDPFPNAPNVQFLAPPRDHRQRDRASGWPDDHQPQTGSGARGTGGS